MTSGPNDTARAPRAFISYGHGSAEHKDLVRRFATFLREDMGIDVHLDVWYEDGKRDWSAWATEHLTDADFILAIASPAYQRRADGRAARTRAAVRSSRRRSSATTSPGTCLPKRGACWPWFCPAGR